MIRRAAGLLQAASGRIAFVDALIEDVSKQLTSEDASLLAERSPKQAIKNARAHLRVTDNELKVASNLMREAIDESIKAIGALEQQLYELEDLERKGFTPE